MSGTERALTRSAQRPCVGMASFFRINAVASLWGPELASFMGHDSALLTSCPIWTSTPLPARHHHEGWLMFLFFIQCFSVLQAEAISDTLSLVFISSSGFEIQNSLYFSIKKL